jgi:Tfp pilus assembly PilM family ATPase
MPTPAKNVARIRRTKPVRALGADFGAQTLKLVEVEWGPLGPVVRTFGVTPYVRNRQNQADLVATLEELKRLARVTSDEVMLALPETDAFLLNTHRDVSVVEQRTQGAHAWQQHLQQRISPELATHAHIWPMSPLIEDSGQVQIGFLAVPRTVLEFYSEVLKAANLKLVGVQHVPTALGRGYSSGRTGLLELGAESTGWYLYDHGILTQHATVPFGSEALTQALALAHGWDYPTAEKHKRSLSGDPSTWPETTQLVVETFLQRLWQDLVMHLAERPAHLDRVILTGGGARFAPVREFVFNQLGLLPEDWRLPPRAHVAEVLRPHIEPHVPVLVNSLSLLVYS